MAELLPGTRVRMQRYKAGQHTELATVVGPENKPGHFRWVGSVAGLLSKDDGGPFCCVVASWPLFSV